MSPLRTLQPRFLLKSLIGYISLNIGEINFNTACRNRVIKGKEASHRKLIPIDAMKGFRPEASQG